VDLRGIPEKELRDRAAYVGQDEHIFDATLRENLQIAAPEADDARLLDALRSAQLSEFTEKLEYGLDTPVGEHGRAISGGQRKRLS
ncbi:ATP-binding cassette domain-containing protein, partial [Klebsiella pneumoniae]|uniref:ATP-binding cassette domain-containing protein n=1 Tax=Klebsiella pneumoniae TaxID=573 RepID=UPI003FD181B8